MIISYNHYLLQWIAFVGNYVIIILTINEIDSYYSLLYKLYNFFPSPCRDRPN